MDIKTEMLKTIRELNWKIIKRKMYDYTNISEKKKKNLLKIDPYFNFEDFVAMIDTTLSENAKEGIVFTTNGLYIKDMLSPTYFINYSDIISSYSTEGSLGNFIITTSTAGNIEYSKSYFEKETGCTAFSELLTQLTAISIKNNFGNSDRATGKIEKNLKLSQEEILKANLVIHPSSAAAGAVGAGLAQIPLTDAAVIIPIQVGMIISLGASLGISVTESAAKGIITGAAMGFIGRGVAQLLVGWIPYAGNAINATTAAVLTQTIGWIAVRHFKVVQSGGYYEGMKVGNVQASRQYEKKYRQQAKEFIEKKVVLENQIAEWTKLMADYIQLIAEYETILGDEKSQKKSKELKIELEKLQSLKVVREIGVHHEY